MGQAWVETPSKNTYVCPPCRKSLPFGQGQSSRRALSTEDRDYRAQIRSLLVALPEGVSKKHRDQWPAATLQAVESQENRAVQVIGFLLKTKLEGPEGPNCHSNDQADRDSHIWLANSPDDDKSDAIVVEITPWVRAEHPSWTTTNLNRLITNKTRVRISGWVLLDPEHPDQVGKTRATIWEIHPIMKIEVFSGGQWQEF